MEEFVFRLFGSTHNQGMLACFPVTLRFLLQSKEISLSQKGSDEGPSPSSRSDSPGRMEANPKGSSNLVFSQREAPLDLVGTISPQLPIYGLEALDNLIFFFHSEDIHEQPTFKIVSRQSLMVDITERSKNWRELITAYILVWPLVVPFFNNS